MPRSPAGRSGDVGKGLPRIRVPGPGVHGGELSHRLGWGQSPANSIIDPADPIVRIGIRGGLEIRIPQHKRGIDRDNTQPPGRAAARRPRGRSDRPVNTR